MPNLLYNGGFDGNLYRWSGSGVIDRAHGYPRAGCAALAAGQSIVSEIHGLGENYLYTLHFFYQLATGATLTAGYSSVTQAFAGAPLGVWREGILSFALDVGVNAGVQFSAAGGACLVDSVTLLQGGLPISRADIASKLAVRLAALVADANLSATASASGDQGDYSAPIDEGLRALGAVNTWSDPDVTALDPGKVNDLLDAVQNALLVQLRTGYALQTDVSLGPRRESRSQIVGNISGLIGGGGSSGGGGARVSVGKLTNGDWPR